MTLIQKSSLSTIANGKIQEYHRDRIAIVYIRQSTLQQVEKHSESTKLQYKLVDKAYELGWPANRVVVIDDDLGRSGANSEGRPGFQRLVAEVGLDRVGIVIGIEMSRLARSCKDWYQLLEVCALFRTLIGDADGIYDPALYNVSSASREYDTWVWYPIVEDERNKEGNLEINFSCLKPGVDHSRSHSSRMGSMFLTDFNQPQMIRSQPRQRLIGSSIDFIDTPFLSLQPMIFGSDLISERSSIRSNPKFPSPSIDFEEESIDKEEVVLMEKSISEGIINTMSQFLNKHEMTKGIWYPNDYRKYLTDEFDIEMDESFCTGFANEKFFEKTGRFTFKLKEGEKASAALLSFLEGPTVADCGNATMACYYKCILDIVGNDKFDELFSSKPFTLTIGQHGITDEKSPISYLSEYTKASKAKTTGILGRRPLEIGQECHFDGIIWYGNKHPEGFGGGWNVIYIGNNEEGQQLFMAHGFEKPLTENEINQKLVELYNRERTPQDEQHVIQAKKPQLYNKETNKYLVSHYTISDEEVGQTPGKFIEGFLVGSIRGLQVDELIKLKNAKNIDQFKLKLMTKKVSSFSESLFF